MTSIIRSALIACAFLGFVAAPAGATTYLYAGNPFQYCNVDGCTEARITGEFYIDGPTQNLDDAHPQLVYITNGVDQTEAPPDTDRNFTQPNAIEIYTDGDENITRWLIGIAESAPGSDGNFAAQLITVNDKGGATDQSKCNTSYLANCNSGFGGGENFNNPGTWRIVPDAVPEPSTWAMMIAGFGMIGFMTRRRKSEALAAMA